MAVSQFYGTGRRKTSVARVYLTAGTGKFTINKKDIDEYFGTELLKAIAKQPLTATETVDKFDVYVNVEGGGVTGQAGAIKHGIARALLSADPEFHDALKKAGFLTSTASKQRDAHLSSRRDNRQQEDPKNLGNTPFPGFFFFKIA